VDAAYTASMGQLMQGGADREMPHKWWIFRHLLGSDGGFLHAKALTQGLVISPLF